MEVIVLSCVDGWFRSQFIYPRHPLRDHFELIWEEESPMKHRAPVKNEAST